MIEAKLKNESEKMMEHQFIQLSLTADEQQLIYLRYNNSSYTLGRYDINDKKSSLLYTTTNMIKQFVLLSESVVFLENTQLKQLLLQDNQVTTLFPATTISTYDDTSFIYEQNGELYAYRSDTRSTQQIAINAQLIPTKGALVVYRKEQELFYWNGEQHMQLPNVQVESAALSFDKKYIALFCKEEFDRHFYVYDIEEATMQNMTAMLGDPIGYEGPVLQQAVVEIPVWTETNAFYFLVTANDEVRLYYGDLYGTLLPASPEEQLIYVYTVAKSGNWAISGLKTKQGLEKLVLLDITSGNEMGINV